MKSKISRTIEILFLIIGSSLFALSLFIKYKFGDAQIEQLLYSLLNAKGTSMFVIQSGVAYCVPIAILLTILFYMPTINYKKVTRLIINIKTKEFKIRIFPIKKYIVYSIIVFFTLLIVSLNSIGAFSYIVKIFETTKIYDDYYIDPKKVKIEFPDKKQNLIFIFVESLEGSYVSSNINDEFVNLIPYMEEIANNNINFSNNDLLGGALNIYGTNWTIAGTIAQTAGIPLKLEIDSNYYDHYSGFLPGVTTLGDILKKNGYKNYYMIGSESEFAGRDDYFIEHGDYEILDYKWAIENDKIDKDYYVNWGYEDKKLFEFAKDKILSISKNDEPFNFTILTSDNHAVDGYLDDSCTNKYGYQYASVINCNDKMVYDFIKWIQKQKFYKNTTIVIVGDHITMQGDIIDYIDENNRTIYNAFINSKIKTENDKNRLFTSFDIFPTTLASLGVTIEGDRLGLGTNLFSNEKTLIEELGYDYVNNEISKRSNYYNTNFLKDTYYEMIYDDAVYDVE